MSTTRIAGEWQLYLSTVTASQSGLIPEPLDPARLAVRIANRAGLEASIRFGGKDIEIRGRVKPGTPSVVTLEEVTPDGGAVEDGLEAILYVPPWRPNIDYDFDVVCGTLVVGEGSAISDKAVREKLVLVTG